VAITVGNAIHGSVAWRSPWAMRSTAPLLRPGWRVTSNPCGP